VGERFALTLGDIIQYDGSLQEIKVKKEEGRQQTHRCHSS
jgi:hypothetical protein